MQCSEYPRPDFERSHHWQCLNGEWDFRADPNDEGLATHWEATDADSWSQHIIVPFAWESQASGIGREWMPVGWYRRAVQRPDSWSTKHTILHFGAVHYACQVWVNGHRIGEHIGGYSPFSLDITDALLEGRGELIVRVEAPLDKRYIPHGKQRSQPADDYDSCCFTASSGIWQPVWLEARPATYIQHLRLTPTPDLKGIHVQGTLAGPQLDGSTLHIQLEGEESPTLEIAGAESVEATLFPASPRLWSPSDPHLYHLQVTLTSEDGEDLVRTYTGLRRVETQGKLILLNGEPIFLRGALDQGFWPTSGYTAPSDQALQLDVELALKAGYNMIRKHIKLEDPRWLYWADTLGLLVWAEPPCIGRYSTEAIASFEAQLVPMVERDYNHPSIILWGIYNEEWGLNFRTAQDREKQEAVARAYDLLSALDHTRPIIDDSGWSHVKTDVLDWHYYDNDLKRWNEVTSSLANDLSSWFGHQIAVDTWYETQLSLPETDHQNLPLINGEYGGGHTARERGWHLRWQTQEFFRHTAFSGYLYTELYDVEHELCGIYTADRQPKDLDCEPDKINAERVVIFDLIPHKPGQDYTTRDGSFAFNVRVAHRGSQALSGTLIWRWGPEGEAIAAAALSLESFTTSDPIELQGHLPTDTSTGRLHVHLVGENGQVLAQSFLDIVMDNNDT
ncbi:glycoside hydrolase family 2 protein [Ktedonospora formicarum]|uniref:Hydrolase n=1 Tax=Ktedonospora formicarum TaxID=2778364 RepID=A0A8J3I6V6_9CHLR|nr:sugar-binding domain-containing protein [Ktedonospora formicarum]GHO45789.1 hydrolase [Ktedonospora formicarum]